MQVDFYQLSRDPVETVLPMLAAKATDGGGRLLVVHSDAERRAAFSHALWARDTAFLANGEAGEPHAERQLVLLGDTCEAANGATMAILADGEWREGAAHFARTILLFGSDQTEAARALWGTLTGNGHALRIFKQREDGGWREGR